jgi:hypothetical protein
MHRRSFVGLAVAASASATSIGYLGGFRSDAQTANETPVASSATQMAATDRTLSVRRARTFDHVVRLNDLGDDPRGRIAAFADLSDRERAVVRSAIDGTHESRDPPEWLREFASGTPFVERADRYYRLDDTLPTYRVTAEAVPPSDVAGEIASYDEYERAVTREEYVASGLLRIARREGIELSYVWPALREFFEGYEAARYHGEVLDFSVEIDDEGPPHELSASEVSVATAVGGAVWNADAAREGVRVLVRRAGRARGAYGFDRAPEGFLDALRDHQYVALGDTFYTSYVESDGPAPVSVSAAFREGRLRLAASNEGDREVRIASGAPRPFGVVRFRPADESNGEADRDARLLWTDAYRTSDHVRTEGRTVESANDAALVSTLAPGDSVAERYAVPADLSPGGYGVEGSLRVEPGGDHGSENEIGKTEDGAGSTVQYRVEFDVE